MMPAPLAFLVAGGLAVSQAVQIELIKMIGIAVSSLAALGAAVLTYLERRELREFRAESRRRRAEVRDPQTEQVVVVDHPPNPEPGANRRADDPPPKEDP